MCLLGIKYSLTRLLSLYFSLGFLIFNLVFMPPLEEERAGHIALHKSVGL